MTKLKPLRPDFACVLLLASLMSVLLLTEGQAKSTSSDRNKQSAQQSATTTLNLGGKLISNINKHIVIQSKLGTVHCAPKVTVFVFANDRGLSIFNFDSNGKEDVKFAIGNRHISIRPAEHLVVSPISEAKFNEINPGLGIVHKKPQQIDAGTGLAAYITEFSLASGVSRIPPLTRMTSSNKPNEKQTIQRILKNAAILQSSAERILQKRPIPSGLAAQMVEIKKQIPTQMLQGTVEKFAQGGQQRLDMRVAECRRRGFAHVAGMSWVELVDNDWKLKDTRRESNNPYEVAGLLTCPVDTVIKTELGYIDCKKGSTVFIVNKESSVAVCTLDSPHVDDVNIRLSNQPPLRLSPGRQILLTQDLESSFDKVNPTHQIGYRDEKEVGTIDGIKIVRADFSLAAAMMSVEPLRRLATSKDGEEIRLAQSIVKNSVILWGLTANHGVFHPPK